MTTRIQTLVAAVAALGAAAMFTVSAQAGTGPGPNSQQQPQSYSYAPSSYTPSGGASSEWNHGGQIKGPTYDMRGWRN